MSNDNNELENNSAQLQDSKESTPATVKSPVSQAIESESDVNATEDTVEIIEAGKPEMEIVAEVSEVELNSDVTLNQADNATEVPPMEVSDSPIVEQKAEIAQMESANTSVDENDEDENDTDDDDSDEDDEDHETEETNMDFSNMSVEELIAAAEIALNNTPREALNRIREIRPLFSELMRVQHREALDTFTDAGNEAENFEFNDGGLRDKMKSLYDQARDARKEEKDRIEKQKVTNLALKREILEKISQITQSDETEQSLAEVKELQQEWKKIRVIPAENVKELWDSYHFYLDKFYDNHSINIELKELDRKKNLETKIELCKKVDELSRENSLKRSFILLNKYQDEFRNTGPVPREYNKEIWERFQGACDKLYEQKKILFDELEEKRGKNLELKEMLVEKALLTVATLPTKQKEWREKTTELDALMAEWKKIGPVPKSNNDQVWKSFRAAFNTFYEHKSNYFKQLTQERKANLIVKEDICKQAEEIKDSEDFNFATKELIRLQKEWKDVGPVPEKVSNAIWKRFRAACDFFFERKNQQFASRREDETNNLNAKKEIITRLNALLASEEKADDLLNTLKGIQKEWNQIGFVPIKQKKEIEDRYHKISDKVFEKFKLDKQSMKSGQAVEHYKHLADLPSGQRRLGDEEQKIKKKMSFLNGEIQTLENNMEFFGRSAGSQKLKKEIEDKIQKTKDQIDRLKVELKAIKKAKSGDAPKPAEVTASTPDDGAAV